jgi:spermidine synthase
MLAFPVLALLVYDFIIFVGAIWRESAGAADTALLSMLFFCSGMPALIYEIVWQRALFAIYGINAQSVAVIVTAFMLGLGIGGLAGGWVAVRFPRQAFLLFGVFELGVAIFGLASLRIFHWAAASTAGASLPHVIVFSVALLLVPTVLMGATLPILVEHLVLSSGRVGQSVAMLYLANTLGSAFACYLCAAFLLREFGQSHTITIAASVNATVGATVLFARRHRAHPSTSRLTIPDRARSSLRPAIAIVIAGVSGFIALGLEIVWFRVFVLASADRAPAFALLLCTYLAGIAAGSYILERAAERTDPEGARAIIGAALLLGGAASPYLPPLVAFVAGNYLPYLVTAVAFFVVAALIGSVFPLLCQLAIAADSRVGRGVSFMYVSNIVGAASGSLIIGFVWMNRFGLRQIAVQLGILAVLTGMVILYSDRRFVSRRGLWAAGSVALALTAAVIAPVSYGRLFERLSIGPFVKAAGTFAHTVENRSGVIEVTQSGAVLGSGVYDGYFNTNPFHDVNGIYRAFAISAFDPDPEKMLMVGLSSGSWAQVLVSHPQASSLRVIEINPGYLRLIPLYPDVQSILRNPKLRVTIDDGRRWLLAHPDARYDLIVQNTTFYWRDHTSNLLSVEYLKTIRQHLRTGGIFYFNTTGSDDAAATALQVFGHGLRVANFLAVSDSPIEVDKTRWLRVLCEYKIDGRLVFDPMHAESKRTLAGYLALADSTNGSPRSEGMETSASLLARIKNPRIITDDNMGWEWRNGLGIP